MINFKISYHSPLSDLVELCCTKCWPLSKDVFIFFYFYSCNIIQLRKPLDLYKNVKIIRNNEFIGGERTNKFMGTFTFYMSKVVAFLVDSKKIYNHFKLYYKKGVSPANTQKNQNITFILLSHPKNYYFSSFKILHLLKQKNLYILISKSFFFLLACFEKLK